MGRRGPKPNAARDSQALALRASGLKLDEIAAELNVTRERARQIVNRATAARLADTTISPARKTQLKHRAQHRCEGCGKQARHKGKSKTLCSDCRAIHNRRTREKKQMLVAAGLCVNCQKPRDREGRLCDRCKQEYMRRYR